MINAILHKSLCLTLLVALFLAVVCSGHLSFDGGLNFMVASQLVESGDYARVYGGLYPFPIESDGFLIFLAAGIIKLFGVSPIAAQLPNALCILGLFTVLYCLLRKDLSQLQVTACLFAATLTPGLFLFGFDGYGEIPMLLPICGALLFLTRYRASQHLGMLWAGALFGLAVSTKVVGLIFAPAFALAMLFSSGLFRLKDKVRDAAVFSVGFIMVYGGWEVYRLSNLGLSRWLEWWRIRSVGITDRAGFTSGLSDTPDVTDKIGRHVELLGGFYGLPAGVLIAAVAIVFVLFFCTLIYGVYNQIKSVSGPEAQGKKSTIVAVFFLTAGLTYLVWWIAMTPTEQAWLRRLFIGLLCLHVAIPLLAFSLLNSGRGKIKLLFSRLLIVTLLATAIHVVVNSMYKEWRKFKSNHELSVSGVEYLRNLDADAQLFGIGWYGAPQFSFHSGKTFKDLALSLLGEIDFTNAYLVLDSNALLIVGDPSQGRFLYPSVLPQYQYEEIEGFWSNPKILRIVGFKSLADDHDEVPLQWSKDNIEALLAKNQVQGVRLSRHGMVATSLVRGWIDASSATNLIIEGALFPIGEYENRLTRETSASRMELNVFVNDGLVGSVQVQPGKHFRIEESLVRIESKALLRIESNFLRIKTGVCGPQDPSQAAYIVNYVKCE